MCASVCPSACCIFNVSEMSSHARLLDKSRYGALRGTRRAGTRTSEKAHSSVAIRGSLILTESSRLDHFLFIPFLLSIFLVIVLPSFYSILFFSLMQSGNIILNLTIYLCYL